MKLNGGFIGPTKKILHLWNTYRKNIECKGFLYLFDLFIYLFFYCNNFKHLILKFATKIK